MKVTAPEEPIVLIEDDTARLELENEKLQRQLDTEQRARRALWKSSQRLKTVFSEQMSRITSKFELVVQKLGDTRQQLVELQQRTEIEASHPFPVKLRLDNAREQAKLYRLQYAKLLRELQLQKPQSAEQPTELKAEKPTKLKATAKPWRSALKPTAPEFVFEASAEASDSDDEVIEVTVVSPKAAAEKPVLTRQSTTHLCPSPRVSVGSPKRSKTGSRKSLSSVRVSMELANAALPNQE